MDLNGYAPEFRSKFRYLDLGCFSICHDKKSGRGYLVVIVDESQSIKAFPEQSED
jgi:hypothetical protein